MASETLRGQPRHDDDDGRQLATTSDADDAVHWAAPFPVSAYTSTHSNMLYARRFAALRYAGHRQLVVHVEGFGAFHTVVYAWGERFRHWACRGCELLSLESPVLDLPFA